MLKRWLQSDSFWKRAAAIWVHLVAAQLAIGGLVVLGSFAFAIAFAIAFA